MAFKPRISKVLDQVEAGTIGTAIYGLITGTPSSQTDLQNGTIQGVFTPVNSVVVTSDSFKTAFQKLQGQINASTIDDWNLTGNTLVSRAVFGSISGSFGWDYKINNVVVGGWSNTGGFNVQNGEFYSAGNLNMILDDTNITVKLLSNAGMSAVGTNNVFAGNSAGNGANGSYLNAFGTLSLFNSTGDDKNAFGRSAGHSSTGATVNFFGADSGKDATGSNLTFFGAASGQTSTGSDVFASGTYAGRLCGESNVVIFGNYYNIYFNYDKARDALSTTLNTVTLQTAQSKDGTNESATTSILKLAQARGTDDADMGAIIIQKAVRTGTANGTRQTLSDWWYFDKDGNTGIGIQSYGSGIGVQSWADATTVPTTNPTGGIIPYVESGVAKYRDPSGNIITI